MIEDIKKIGRQLENYISSNITEDVIDVTRDINHPGVDFIINGENYDIKNAWNTENGGNATLRKSRGIRKWYRKNKDGTYNWHIFPNSEMKLSENGFRDFIDVDRYATLEDLFDEL